MTAHLKGPMSQESCDALTPREGPNLLISSANTKFTLVAMYILLSSERSIASARPRNWSTSMQCL